MTRIMLIILFVLFDFNYCYAADFHSTAPIPLRGGAVLPKEGQLNISLSKLYPRAFYKVTCDITNSNYNQTNPIILGIGYQFKYNPNSAFSPSLKLNSKLVSKRYCITCYGQAKLDQKVNKYEADYIKYNTQNPYLYFINFDDSNSAIVKNCYASVMITG